MKVIPFFIIFVKRKKDYEKVIIRFGVINKWIC
jgi:hypothetical protein